MLHSNGSQCNLSSTVLIRKQMCVFKNCTRHNQTLYFRRKQQYYNICQRKSNQNEGLRRRSLGSQHATDLPSRHQHIQSTIRHRPDDHRFTYRVVMLTQSRQRSVTTGGRSVLVSIPRAYPILCSK